MIVLYIIVFILLFVLLLLSLPITVKVRYNEKFNYNIYYSVIKISPQKINKKSKQKTKAKNEGKKKSLGYFSELLKNKPLPEAIAELCNYLSISLEKLALVLKRSSVMRFRLKIIESDSDAATAAINYGKICATVYPFLGFLNSHMTFKEQKVQIYCDYSGQKSEFKFYLKWRLIPLLCIGPLFSLLLEFIKSKGR